MYEMKDEYLTGIGEIDKEHAVLFEIKKFTDCAKMNLSRINTTKS